MELNAIAPVKTLAPYRRGKGHTGKGIRKRVRELQTELKTRRWGESAPTLPRLSQNGGTGSNSIGVSGGVDGGNGRNGEEDKKRRRKKKKRDREGHQLGLMIFD